MGTKKALAKILVHSEWLGYGGAGYRVTVSRVVERIDVKKVGSFWEVIGSDSVFLTGHRWRTKAAALAAVKKHYAEKVVR